METVEKKILLRQIIWDYSISLEHIEALLNGEKKSIGHLTRELIFQKILETYPWFTIIQLFTLDDIKELLTNQAISKLRSKSLQKKYEFVQQRLSQIIPASE